MKDNDEQSNPSTGSTLWVIYRAWPFSAMTANGMNVKVDPGEPTRFMPVFETRAQAVKWYGKDDESIYPIKVG
jgi:hypothetical protein